MFVDEHRSWTWREFNAKVDELCPLESKRLFGQMCAAGQTPVWNYTDGSSVFYRNQIRQAMLDLQQYVPEFKKNHETIYYQQDFSVDGMASVGALPPNARVQSVWFYSVDKQKRVPVMEVGWGHRFKLATMHQHWMNPDAMNGFAITQTASSLAMLATFNDLHRNHDLIGVMAIAPDHERFYVHPRVEAEWLLSVFWDGEKLEWKADEQVPLGEDEAGAVALFVQSAFRGYVERNFADAAVLSGEYRSKRTNIFLKAQSKGKIK